MPETIQNNEIVCIVIMAGTCMLILTSTEVDTTGASYYGEQSLHFINVKGDASLVPFGKYHLHGALSQDPDHRGGPIMGKALI